MYIGISGDINTSIVPISRSALRPSARERDQRPAQALVQTKLTTAAERFVGKRGLCQSRSIRPSSRGRPALEHHIVLLNHLPSSNFSAVPGRFSGDPVSSAFGGCEKGTGRVVRGCRSRLGSFFQMELSGRGFLSTASARRRQEDVILSGMHGLFDIIAARRGCIATA